MKKLFLTLFVVCAAFMASSCTIIFNDNCEVQIKNTDSNRKAYIETVYCRDSWGSSEKWTEVWNYDDNNEDDSNVIFYVDSGNKDFKIIVVEPTVNKSTGKVSYDRYAVTLTEFFVMGWGTNVLVYDGYDLYAPDSSDD